MIYFKNLMELVLNFLKTEITIDGYVFSVFGIIIFVGFAGAVIYVINGFFGR